MRLHKDGKLPQGEAWNTLVARYPEMDDFNLRCQSEIYGYKNVDSFQRAMRKRGIHRKPIEGVPLKEIANVIGTPDSVDVPLENREMRIDDKHHTNKEEPLFRIHNIEHVANGELLELDEAQSHINIPLKLETDNGTKVVAFIFDTHVPYQDKHAVNMVREFLKERQPDYLVWGGDVCDFYQISTFDKNPGRIGKLQSDLDETRNMLWDFRIDLPNTVFYYLEGNHEFRLQKFLWTKAEALSSLRSLQLSELLTLKDYQTELIAYEKGLMINNVFLALHGDIASIHSGYSAKRLYEKHGGSGIAGHCHRQGSFLKRNRFGFFGWWEGGCLCDLEPDYCTHPNWVNGFSLVTFIGDRFFVESIPIINGKFIFGSKLYE